MCTTINNCTHLGFYFSFNLNIWLQQLILLQTELFEFNIVDIPLYWTLYIENISGYSSFQTGTNNIGYLPIEMLQRFQELFLESYFITSALVMKHHWNNWNCVWSENVVVYLLEMLVLLKSTLPLASKLIPHSSKHLVTWLYTMQIKEIS